MESKKGITVYCSSSDKIAPIYFEAARALGAAIARHGLPVINGGGKMGLMAAVTDGALECGGEAIGVIPQFMVDSDRHHKRLTTTIITADMHERKRTMAELSRAVIALPGGVGTFEELTEMLTWRKLHLYEGNVVIFNVDGYYDPLIELLRRSVELGFSEADDAKRWLVAETVEQAISLALK